MMTREQYTEEAERMMKVRPFIGIHRVGELTIVIGQRAWTCKAEKHFTMSGNNTTPLGMRTGVARAIREYAKLYAR
jgi:hypothetical protein